MKILFAGNVHYHTDNAAKFRLLEVVRSFQELGHDVVLYDGLSPVPPTPYGDGRAMRVDRSVPPAGLIDRVARKVGIGFGLLAQPLAHERFDVIYCYGTELSWLTAAWLLARRKRARLFVDVPELYGLEDMTASFSAFRARVGGWCGAFPGVPLLADAVIVPSKRFLRLYSRFHSRVRLLPPFFADLNARQSGRVEAGTLTLAYAGSPSNKEWLSLIFEALRDIRISDGQRIDFVLVGLQRSDVEAIARDCHAESLLARADINVVAKGQVDVASARAVVQAADFSIVIRRQSVRVNFGFPSKVAEAFRLGTPVISNVYSDIADYLEDGVNGWIVADENAHEIRDILARCLAMTHTEKSDMRVHAAHTGTRFFSGDASVRVLQGLVADRAK